MISEPFWLALRNHFPRFFVVSLFTQLVQFTLALILAPTGYETAVAFAPLIAIPSIPFSGAIGTRNSGY